MRPRLSPTGEGTVAALGGGHALPDTGGGAGAGSAGKDGCVDALDDCREPNWGFSLLLDDDAAPNFGSVCGNVAGAGREDDADEEPQPRGNGGDEGDALRRREPLRDLAAGVVGADLLSGESL